jgi:hypothetical protein
MIVLEAKRRGALALLAFFFFLAVLSALEDPYAALPPLLIAVLIRAGYAQRAKEILEEKAAKRLGLVFFRKPELPAVSLLPEGEPKTHGEYRGEVLGRPFRRFEVQVYGARRFGAVGYRFTGVLYEVELPRPFPSPPGPQGLAHLPQGALALPLGPLGAFWVSSSPSSPGTSRATPS